MSIEFVDMDELARNHNGVNPIGWTVTGLKLECPPGWLN